MLNEFKKITSEVYVKVAFIIVIFASIIVSIIAVNSISELTDVNSTNYVHGKAAINLIKQRYKDSKGLMTIDKMNQVLKYYKSMPAGSESYLKTCIKYPGIADLINNVYSDDSGKENEFAKLNNMNGFYDRNIKLINDTLHNTNQHYTEAEKKIIFQQAKSVEKPFRIDAFEQWPNMYSSLTICFIIIAISAILVGSNLFSYEKDKKMDVLLVALGNKSLKKITKNKMAALIAFLTLEFLVGVLIISGITFAMAGTSAWNSQIQVQYFTSIYHLTFGQTYLLFLFTGWICILAIGIFVALLNAFNQKSYLSLIIGLVITFMPVIIGKINSLPDIITKFINSFPIKGLFIINNLSSLHIYNLIFTNTLTVTAIIIMASIVFVIGIVLCPVILTKRIRSV